MKRMNHLTTTFAGLAASLVFALSAQATSGQGENSRRGCARGDVIVMGTSDSTRDIPAVQAAVDNGGGVCLRGSFSFDLVPTHSRTIVVKNAVVISGAADDEGTGATIVGGWIPFSVEAPGASVTIQGLRFDRTVGIAMAVRAAAGVVIANCVIGHVEPAFAPAADPRTKVNNGILVFPFKSPPENVSGNVSILDNDIDLGGTDIDRGFGIIIINSGKTPGNEVDVHVSGNRIRNTVAMSIDMRDIGGRAEVDGNVITTGAIGGACCGSAGGGPNALVGGIRCLGSGSYTITHNTVDAAFGNAAGIRVQSRDGSRPVTHAVVADNDITMSAAAGTVFGTENAAIEIRGAAHDNVVAHNRIRGTARFALSVVPEGLNIPSNNAFLMNNEPDFAASIADVFVGQGVINTAVIGPQLTIVDLGVGTIFIPVHESRD